MVSEYKCDFNSPNSLNMLMYSVNNSIFEIFKCALRDSKCFLVTPCRLPPTDTSIGLCKRDGGREEKKSKENKEENEP